MIWIKNLRIFKNIDEKEDSQVHLFDTIISSKYLLNNHILKIKSPFSLISAFISKPTTSLSALLLFLPHITSDINKPTILRSG